MITAIVVDDEQLARAELIYLLKAHGDIHVVGEGRSGTEALQLVKEHEPDLLFLDINMPGQNGLEVVRKLIERRGKAKLPQVIFATAYDQYAVQAFEISAVDYLLKPIEKLRLAQSLQRVRRFHESFRRTPEKMGNSLDGVLKALQSLPLTAVQSGAALPAASQAKLMVRSGNRMLLIDARDLICAAMQDGRLAMVAKDCEGESNFKSLDELQAVLPAASFWRAHRAHLVNIDHVREVIPWFKSTYKLLMNDRKGTEILVSRAQTSRLRELFNL